MVSEVCKFRPESTMNWYKDNDVSGVDSFCSHLGAISTRILHEFC